MMFPAMSSQMFQHPLTARHIQTVQEVIGFSVIGPRPNTKLFDDKRHSESESVKTLKSLTDVRVLGLVIQKLEG